MAGGQSQSSFKTTIRNILGRNFSFLNFKKFHISASAISTFCSFWHFGFIAFLHSAISDWHFCNFLQAFPLLQFLAFLQLLLFPWPWKFWFAVFSFRLHWCLGFYFVSCFLYGSDQGVCDVEYAGGSTLISYNHCTYLLGRLQQCPKLNDHQSLSELSRETWKMHAKGKGI